MRKRIFTGLLGIFALVSASSGAFAAEPRQTYIVITSGSSYSAVDSEIGALGGTTQQRWGAIHGFSASLTATEAAALSHTAGVTAVSPNSIAHIAATQNPTPSWGLDRTDQAALPLDNSFSYPDTAGAGVRVYIVDTGVQGNNPDFAGRMATGIDEVTANGNPAVDCHGHGTHTAGTAAGSVYGIAKFATIVPVRVLDCTGSGSYTGIIAGLNWIAANNPVGTPAVVSMSLGGVVDTTLNATIAILATKNIVSVVAAGNDGLNACNYSPASEPTAITVGATDTTDARASFSNYGSCVDLFAPGVNITSDLNSAAGGSQVMSGTSMATPHVTGAVAEYLSLNPTATTAQVTSALIGGAVPGIVGNSLTPGGNYLLNTTFINNLATPSTAVPNTPTALAAGTVTSTSVALSWVAPANTNSNPATSYKVEYKPTTGSSWSSLTSSSTSATVTGLTGLTSYDFRVSAVNSVGTGTATSSVSATTRGTAPAAPTGLNANGITSTSITLNWTPPTNVGSSPITSYTVEYKRSNVATYTSTTVTTNTAVISGLTAASAYNFRVSATNTSGTSSPSAVLNVSTSAAPVVPTVPTAPRTLSTATAYGDAIAMRWTAPTTSGGTLTGYVVQRNVGGTWTTLATLSGTTTSYTATALTASTSYQFQVLATNATGPSPASNTLTVSTTSGTPATVAGLRSANLTTTGATLSWTAITAPNFSSPTTYNVRVYSSGTGALLHSFIGVTSTTQAVATLTTKTAYQFDVTAVSNGISGTASNKTNFTTR
jgi:subtilisin family serine protease